MTATALTLDRLFLGPRRAGTGPSRRLGPEQVLDIAVATGRRGTGTWATGSRSDWTSLPRTSHNRRMTPVLAYPKCDRRRENLGHHLGHHPKITLLNSCKSMNTIHNGIVGVMGSNPLGSTILTFSNSPTGKSEPDRVSPHRNLMGRVVGRSGRSGSHSFATVGSSSTETVLTGIKPA